MIEEIYKKHKSGYLVSNYGNIKGKNVEFIKPTKTSSGYLVCGEGFVHRIVIETFIGEIPKNYEVDHLNGIKDDNRLENLEIVSRSENQKRTYITGSKERPIGEKNPMSTLTEENVLDIYDMIKKYATNTEIANKYHLHDRYVSLIRHGKRWGHVWDKHFKQGDSMISSGCHTVDIETMLHIIHLISTTDMQNKEIGKLAHIDVSTISKVRHKHVWKDIWRLYHKNLNNIEESNSINCMGNNIKVPKRFKTDKEK